MQMAALVCFANNCLTAQPLTYRWIVSDACKACAACHSVLQLTKQRQVQWCVRQAGGKQKHIQGM